MTGRRLEGRVVVVVGGAGLLGRAFCRAVAEHGGTVVVADRDEPAAAALAAAIEDSGGVAVAQVIDITSTASVDAAIAAVQGRRGRIDAVVNCAYPRNASYGRRLEDVEYADFCENVNWHLGGYFLVGQRFARCFAERGEGHIINVASIYGVMAPRFEVYEGTSLTMPVEYAAIKAAIVHLTRYFAQYYRKAGLRCNAIAPGGILDGQPEPFVERYAAHAGTRGMLAPNDVTGTLVFLLSDESRYMNGQVLVVDDGFTL
jgi:NAD(P)-dependent dehydrogenase (short-subunit alcohol dehydrogenase family)